MMNESRSFERSFSKKYGISRFSITQFFTGTFRIEAQKKLCKRSDIKNGQKMERRI